MSSSCGLFNRSRMSQKNLMHPTRRSTGMRLSLANAHRLMNRDPGRSLN
jgi:hypothetical protein